MSYVPTPWEAVLLTAFAFRLWKLLAEDDVLLWARARVLGLGEWRNEGDPVPDGYRRRLGEFIECPWCFGFHISWIVWLAWLIEPHWTLVLSTPFAISAGVGIIRLRLDSE